MHLGRWEERQPSQKADSSQVSCRSKRWCLSWHLACPVARRQHVQSKFCGTYILCSCTLDSGCHLILLPAFAPPTATLCLCLLLLLNDVLAHRTQKRQEIFAHFRQDGVTFYKTTQLLNDRANPTQVASIWVSRNNSKPEPSSHRSSTHWTIEWRGKR